MQYFMSEVRAGARAQRGGGRLGHARRPVGDTRKTRGQASGKVRVVVGAGDESPLVVILLPVKGAKPLLVDLRIDADDGSVVGFLRLAAEVHAARRVAVAARISASRGRRRVGAGKGSAGTRLLPA